MSANGGTSSTMATRARSTPQAWKLATRASARSSEDRGTRTYATSTFLVMSEADAAKLNAPVLAEARPPTLTSMAVLIWPPSTDLPRDFRTSGNLR